jgi:hypothetical protein
MLTNSSQMKGLVIRATDGEIGTVDQLYFDDETWAIRYLTVDTGGWLGGRQVLISPISVVTTDWQARRLDVSLTKKQVEQSPDIDTHQPVSRQHEAAYLDYYGYPYYWGGPYLWGPALNPASLGAPLTYPKRAIPETTRGESQDSHLRSTEGVAGLQLRRPMVKLAMFTAFLWTMTPGRSAISTWRRRIGGRARGCWFRPPGLSE